MHAGERPKDGGAWMRRVEAKQADLDNRIRATGAPHAAGTSTGTSDGIAEASFLFGTVFPATPVVTLTGWAGGSASLISVGPSGFTARFEDFTGAAIISGPVTVSWYARLATI